MLCFGRCWKAGSECPDAVHHPISIHQRQSSSLHIKVHLREFQRPAWSQARLQTQPYALGLYIDGLEQHLLQTAGIDAPALSALGELLTLLLYADELSLISTTSKSAAAAGQSGKLLTVSSR